MLCDNEKKKIRTRVKRSLNDQEEFTDRSNSKA